MLIRIDCKSSSSESPSSESLTRYRKGRLYQGSEWRCAHCLQTALRVEHTGCRRDRTRDAKGLRQLGQRPNSTVDLV